MSLEQALNDNTAAMKELGLIMAGLKLPAAVDTVDTEAAVTEVKTTTAKKDTAKAPKADAEKPAAEAPAADAAAVTVTYDDAKTAVTALVKKHGRDAGLAVLGKFGTDSLINVPAEKWAAVIEACNTAIGEAPLA